MQPCSMGTPIVLRVMIRIIVFSGLMNLDAEVA